MNISLFSSGLNIACHTVTHGQSPPPTRLSGWTRGSSGLPSSDVLGPSVAGRTDARGPLCAALGSGASAAGPGRDLLSWHFPVLFDIRKHFFFPALLMNGLKVAPSLFSLFVHSVKSQRCLNTNSRANSSSTVAAWFQNAVQVSLTSDLGTLECCHSIL